MKTLPLILLLLLTQIALSKVKIICLLNSSCSSSYSWAITYGQYQSQTFCSQENCSLLVGLSNQMTVRSCQSDDLSNGPCSSGLCVILDNTKFCSAKQALSTCKRIESNIQCGRCQTNNCYTDYCLSTSGIQACIELCIYSNAMLSQFSCNQTFGNKSCDCCNQLKYHGSISQCSTKYPFDQMKLRGQIEVSENLVFTFIMLIICAFLAIK